MVQDYVPPADGLSAFNCPHCGAFAHQKRFQGVIAINTKPTSEMEDLESVSVTICDRCNKFVLWKKSLLYPQTCVAPIPVADMPQNVKNDYEEARAIFSQSPRGAAALLRLAIQKLTVSLGENGKDLNESIGNLVKRGLRADIQKALDVVRVVGNNAVHPGELNVETIQQWLLVSSSLRT